MQFEDMSWMDVEAYLKVDNRIVVITGACEQHAYLSLLTDIRVPTAIANAACQRENVLIAPPLNFGISPYFTTYPGTISLKPETFAAIVREVLGGLIGQGFKRILVSNGHGGNSGVLTPLMIELSTAHAGTNLVLFEAWRDPAVFEVAQAAGLAPNHANWAEAFPFTVVGDMPSGDKPAPDFPRTGSAEAQRAALGDGNFGGPYQASDEVMQKMFDAAVESMVKLLKAL
jgi:creatinine amidohydrolase